MRKTLHKWFWIWDFDKEELWLDKMAQDGLALTAVGFCSYTFEPCEAGEYNIRLEMLDNMPGTSEGHEYIKFIEETGAEYLGNVLRWAYFRMKADKGEFKLFSDNSSRIKHLSRMSTMLTVLTIAELIICLSNFTMYLSHGSEINLFFTLLLFCLSLLILYGLFKIRSKVKKLRKEQQLFE